LKADVVKQIVRNFEEKPGRRFLFLTGREWRTGLLLAVVGAVLTAWFTVNLSPWLSVTVFVVILTVYHMRYAAAFIVPLPHIAILISALEYVLAAWCSLSFPPVNPVYDIGSVLPSYLEYSGPVIVAICLGWGLSLVRLRPIAPASISTGVLNVLPELDLLLAVGLVTTIVGRLVQMNTTSFDFVILLVSYLRFVGVYGRMVLRAPGWQWRLALVLITEVFFATETAMFNPLLIWGAWTFAVWLYSFRPSPARVLAPLLVAALLLPALQESKWRLRGGLPDIDAASGVAYETNRSDQLSIDRVFSWLGYLADGLGRTLTLDLDDEFLGDTVTRYNQGWIVVRVMSIVPDAQPYAKGDTLKEAAIAALLPRMFAPGKIRAGGQEHMALYAGIELNEQTSMNLGYAGELYANFGRLLGTVACGFYALGFGLLFRFICVRAFRQPLWWSVVPYIFFVVLKGDDGIAEVLTWTVKAALVIAGVIFILPNLRGLLFGQSNRQESALPRQLPPVPVIR